MSDITPTRVVSLIDSIQAPVGRSYVELRNTLVFLNTADRDAFVGTLGLGTPGSLGWSAITAKPALKQMLAGITAPAGGTGCLDSVNIVSSGFDIGRIVWFLDGSNTIYSYVLTSTGTLPATSAPETIRPLTAFGTAFWQLLSTQSTSNTFGDDTRYIFFDGQLVIADKFSGNGQYLTNLQAANLTGAMAAGVTIDAGRLTSGIIPPDRFGSLFTMPDLDYSYASATFAGGNAGIVTQTLGGSHSYALPPVSAYPAGAFFRVYDQAGVVSNTKMVTVTANGSDTINGAASMTLSQRWGVLVLRSLGAGKWQGWIESRGPAINTVELDLGSSPVESGTFDITGLAGLSTNAAVIITQANGPYTAKGTLDDDSEFDALEVTAYCLNSTTIRAHWASQTGVVTGNFKFNYLV